MEQAKQQVWNIKLTVTKNNGFPLQIIHKFKNKFILKTQKKERNLHPHKHKKKGKLGQLHISQSTHTQGYQFI